MAAMERQKGNSEIPRYPALNLVSETEVLRRGGIDVIFRLPYVKGDYKRTFAGQHHVLSVASELVEKAGAGIDNLFLLYPEINLDEISSEIKGISLILGLNFFYEGSPLQRYKKEGSYHRLTYTPSRVESEFLRDEGLIGYTPEGNGLIAFGAPPSFKAKKHQGEEIAYGLGLRSLRFACIPLQGGAFITTEEHVFTCHGTLQWLTESIKHGFGVNLSYQEAKDLLRSIIDTQEKELVVLGGGDTSQPSPIFHLDLVTACLPGNTIAVGSLALAKEVLEKAGIFNVWGKSKKWYKANVYPLVKCDQSRFERMQEQIRERVYSLELKTDLRENMIRALGNINQGLLEAPYRYARHLLQGTRTLFQKEHFQAVEGYLNLMAEEIARLGYDVRRIPTVLTGSEETFPTLYGGPTFLEEKKESLPKYPHFVPANGILVPTESGLPMFVTMRSLKPLDEAVAKAIGDRASFIGLENLGRAGWTKGSLRCMTLILPRGLLDPRSIRSIKTEKMIYFR